VAFLVVIRRDEVTIEILVDGCMYRCQRCHPVNVFLGVSIGGPPLVEVHTYTEISRLFLEHTNDGKAERARATAEPEVGEWMIARLIPEAQDAFVGSVNTRYIYQTF
jgi:hypothetical protein